MLKIRSFSTYFIFNDEDWRDLSSALSLRFPDAVCFFHELKKPILPHNEKAAKGWPLSYASTLQELFDMQTEERSHYFMRDPWPEDVASGRPIDLIGGWETGRMIGTPEGYRRHGKCVEFVRNSVGVGRKRLATCPDYFGGFAVERLGTLPASSYGDAKCYYDPKFSSLEVEYNSLDRDVRDFAFEVRRIVRRLGTRNVALYHPITREILDPQHQTKKAIIGWNILRGGTGANPLYLMMHPGASEGGGHPRRQGAIGLIGPRLDHPFARKRTSA